MSNGKSPFVKKTSNCPVCGSPSENRFFIPKSFVEKEVESDRHVKAYRWLDPEFQEIHPPFYHFWHCPTCKYTSTQRDFLKPGEDAESNFSTLKQYFLKIDPSRKQIVQFLASDINFDRMNFCMAINLHLLASFIQECAPTDAKDTSKLGSYYLRTGWLFREQTGKGDSDGLLAKQMDFLEKVSKLWTDVPKSEAECLIKAAAFFELAYQSHPRYSDIVVASDLMLLISDLYCRSKDFKSAMRCLNTIMQSGQKFRAQQQEVLRREKEAGKLNLTRKAQIDAQTNRVNVLMERAGGMRQDIIAMRVADQEPKARQVVAQMEGQDVEVIREKLKEMEFEPALITKLLGEPKKKKFLGLF